MDLIRSLQAVQGADGDGLVDWDAAAQAAIASTPPGELSIDPATETAYREGVIEARDAVATAVDAEVALPERIEVLHRHHWIEMTAAMFERMVDPALPPMPDSDLSRTINTGTAGLTLGVLGRRVIGQYDPALFATPAEAGLYIVHPNVEMVAAELEADPGRFRRWVLHHEVSHAAEFAMAPWLRSFLEEHLERTLSNLGRASIDRDALGELNRGMTVIEGFAEVLMDEAMDDDVSQLRERIEARRSGLGPIRQLVDWLLGISAKRRQYERGRRFFADVMDARGLEATLAVWASPEHLPTEDELDDPTRWLHRVDP